jgi:hypothetical protein
MFGDNEKNESLYAIFRKSNIKYIYSNMSILTTSILHHLILSN